MNRLKIYLNDDQRFGRLVEDAPHRKETALEVIEGDIRRKERELGELGLEDAEIFSQLMAQAKNGTATVDWLEGKISAVKVQRQQKEAELEVLKIKRHDLLSKSGLTALQTSVREFIDGFDELTGTQRRNLVEKIVKQV